MRLNLASAAATVGMLIAGAVPAAAAVDAPVAASGASTFLEGCNGAQSGTLYRNTEVEPYVDVNPMSTGDATARLIGVYQQDRYSNGGARGQGTSVSGDGGRSWRHPLRRRAAELLPVPGDPAQPALRACHRSVGQLLAQRERPPGHPVLQRPCELRQRGSGQQVHGRREHLERPEDDHS